MDDTQGDPQLPHHRNPDEFVSPDHLAGTLMCFFYLLSLSKSTYIHDYPFDMFRFLVIKETGNPKFNSSGICADLGVLHWKLNDKVLKEKDWLTSIYICQCW